MGAGAETVRTTEEFQAAFDRALHSAEPYLIEILTDPEILSPSTTISGLRQF